jgi:hypothetical protein
VFLGQTSYQPSRKDFDNREPSKLLFEHYAEEAQPCYCAVNVLPKLQCVTDLHSPENYEGAKKRDLLAAFQLLVASGAGGDFNCL